MSANNSTTTWPLASLAGDTLMSEYPIKKGLNRSGCRPCESQSLRLCEGLKFWKVFRHLSTIKRFVSALVAGAAIHLGHITFGSEAICRELVGERNDVLVVQITRHPNAVPRCDALRPRLFPRCKVARVVAISAIHTQRFRHVHHQRIGELSLLGRCAIGMSACTSHGCIAIDTNRLCILQVRCKGVKRQRR